MTGLGIVLPALPLPHKGLTHRAPVIKIFTSLSLGET